MGQRRPTSLPTPGGSCSLIAHSNRECIFRTWKEAVAERGLSIEIDNTATGLTGTSVREPRERREENSLPNPWSSELLRRVINPANASPTSWYSATGVTSERIGDRVHGEAGNTVFIDNGQGCRRNSFGI